MREGVGASRDIVMLGRGEGRKQEEEHDSQIIGRVKGIILRLVSVCLCRG